MSAPPPYHRSPYLAKKRAAIDSELRGEQQPETKNAARDRASVAAPTATSPARAERDRGARATANAARGQAGVGGRGGNVCPSRNGAIFGPGRGARVRKRLNLMAMLYGKRR